MTEDGLSKIELYYAKMEAARNLAEEAYFKHRGFYDTKLNHLMFCAGFERAYELLWNSKPAAEVKTCSQCGGAGLYLDNDLNDRECLMCDAAEVKS